MCTSLIPAPPQAMHVPLPGRQGARGPRGVRRGGVVLVDPGEVTANVVVVRPYSRVQMGQLPRVVKSKLKTSTSTSSKDGRFTKKKISVENPSSVVLHGPALHKMLIPAHPCAQVRWPAVFASWPGSPASPPLACAGRPVQRPLRSPATLKGGGRVTSASRPRPPRRRAAAARCTPPGGPVAGRPRFPCAVQCGLTVCMCVVWAVAAHNDAAHASQRGAVSTVVCLRVRVSHAQICAHE